MVFFNGIQCCGDKVGQPGGRPETGICVVEQMLLVVGLGRRKRNDAKGSKEVVGLKPVNVV